MSMFPCFYYNFIIMPEYSTRQMMWASILALLAVFDVGIGLLCLIAGVSQLEGIQRRLANNPLVLGGAALCCAGMLYLVMYVIVLLLHLRRQMQSA